MQQTALKCCSWVESFYNLEKVCKHETDNMAYQCLADDSTGNIDLNDVNLAIDQMDLSYGPYIRSLF